MTPLDEALYWAQQDGWDSVVLARAAKILATEVQRLTVVETAAREFYEVCSSTGTWRAEDMLKLERALEGGR